MATNFPVLLQTLQLKVVGNEDNYVKIGQYKIKVVN
jgi:hypothetical protein